MTVRQIVMFPDPRLRAVAAPVTVFDGALKALAGDLLDTLRAAQGLGITAPHIGIPARVVVIELAPADGVRTYVNPELTWTSDTMARHQEGSLSLPGVAEQVERPDRVRVRFQDTDGAEHAAEADGLLAACLQHEIDQLDGLFWIQRLSRLKRERLLKRHGKARRASLPD
ncbi:peptide deformylase [Xanthobacter sp. V4C-4]|uniref:peptide deformylase n=1 Tax=Xanthobacter cornucopiae TaxID=3119924 RepID=UPI003727A028